MRGVNPSFDLLQSIIEKALKENYPPSIEVSISEKGKNIFHKHWGQKYRYWDVASLTKVMATTASLMNLYDQKQVNLKKPISFYLGFMKGTRPGKITVQQLLTHTSGLSAHEKFYLNLKKIKPHSRTEWLKKKFQTLPVNKSPRAVYSDLDFIFLGWIIEELTGLVLEKAVQELSLNPLKLKETRYHPQNKPKYDSSLYAPTEKCPWRKKILQGEVHDDNTWVMGGVAGHAGLFSSAKDVESFGVSMVNSFKGRRGFVSSKTTKLFLSRAIPHKRGDWTLGFMLPSEEKSSAGDLADKNCVGHTGFTGVSLWMDVRREIVITILSNRVNPTRKDERFVALRPRLHDAIWSQLLPPPADDEDIL